MNKILITSLLAVSIALSPGVVSAEAPLQAKPIFPFFSSEKSTVTPAPVEPAPAEMTEEAFDLTTLKNQPLSIRRKMVATELDAIYGRLSVLNDKTKAATLLLSKNEINTLASEEALATATLSLAAARLTIDSLLASANDPANESTIVLLIGTATFKDVVIKAENELRDSRTSIISALSLLKSAVSVPTASAN